MRIRIIPPIADGCGLLRDCPASAPRDLPGRVEWPEDGQQERDREQDHEAERDTQIEVAREPVTARPHTVAANAAATSRPVTRLATKAVSNPIRGASF